MDKSYVKVLFKKGVSGGTGFEGELQMVEGTSEEVMKDLIEKTVRLSQELLDKKFG